MSDPVEINEPRDEAAPTPGPGEPATGLVASVTRLAIGGLLMGVELLSRDDPVVVQEEATEVTVTEERDVTAPTPPPPPAPEQSTARYALIGLMFESQNAIRRGAARAGRVEQAIWRRTARLRRPLGVLARPVQKPFNKLVARGETTVARWVETGRAEEELSRALTKSTLEDTVDLSIERLAENESIQYLVAQQGTTIAGSIADEIRERTVSADLLAEGLVRRLLLRPSRVSRPALPIVVPEDETEALPL
jgi:hypothetical protein